MQFSSIIGQQKLKQQLVASVENKKIPHAIMLLGNEGSGNLPLALAFAQYLNCEKVSSLHSNSGELFGESTAKIISDSCGECSSCLKASKLIHPDIHFTFPVVSSKDGKSVSKPTSADFMEEWRKYFLPNPYLSVQDWLESLDAENKQGNITAEECQEIIRKLNLKTFESHFKIFILWMPELLGKEGNILLKSLEEPQENTIFILVAENEEAILSTILSRVQIIKVPRIADEDLIEQLEKNENIAAKEAHSIARLANGNYSEALRLIRNAEDDNEKLFLHFLRICVSGKHENQTLINFTEKSAGLGRENLKGLIRYGLDLFREVIVLDYLGEKKTRLTESELKLAQYVNSRLLLNSKEEIVRKLEESYYHLERNANPKMLFMNLGIFISQVLKRKEIVLT